MRPLRALGAAEAAALCGVVFDLDDTLLDGSRLGAETYVVLHELRDAGLRLVACTGRPAGWGEVVARQWPLDLAVTENGAIAFQATAGRLVRLDRLAPDARAARRAELAELVRELRARCPDAVLADDNWLRLSDATFDVGEHRRVGADERRRLREHALSLGASCVESSIHLHVTLDRDDKASGTLRALALACGDDPTAARQRYAFVGDSANDAACFAAFRTSFGVANVRDHVRALSVPPRYVSTQPRGAGFVEIGRWLLDHRESASQAAEANAPAP